MRYYASAETMAESLALPLLLRVDVDSRFLERHDRLSAYAAERPHAARLHHRALAALGVDSWKGCVIWVTGPFGSLEHLPWAVGLAEQLTDQGLRVYLGAKGLELPITEPGGLGEQIPGALGEWVDVHLKPGLVSFATDLAGVRALAPGQGSRTAPMSPAALILADALPEELEGAYPDGAGIDATVLVAAFRDHGVHELESVTRGLLAAGHRVVGLVALGPQDGTGSDRPGASQIREPLLRRDVPATPTPPPAPAPPPSTPTLRSSPAAPPAPTPPSAPNQAPARKVSPPSVEPQESSLSRAQEKRAKDQAAPPAPSYSAAARVRPSSADRAAKDPAQPPPSEETQASVALPSIAVPAAEMRPENPRPAEAVPPARAPIEPAPSRTAPITGTPATPTAPATQSAPVPSPKPAAPAVPSASARAGKSGGTGAVPLFASWEAETRRDRRVRGLAAAVALVALLAIGGAAGFKYAQRHGWIGATARTTSTEQAVPGSVVAPSAPLDVPAGAMPAGAASIQPDSTAARSDRLESDAQRASEPRAPGLEDIGDAPASGRRSAIDARPQRPFPWVEPKRAVAAADSGVARRSVAGDSSAGAIETDQGDYVVHLSSFRLEREAETEVRNLEGQGIEARYLLVDVPEKGAWYRVVTGRFATFPEAEAMAMRLCRQKGIPRTHVAGLGGRGAPVPVDSLAGVPAASRPRMD